jgi:hypothetical protein
MNDELTGQLTNTSWRIPGYLHGLLYLETDTETVSSEGPTGLFELSVPARKLNLRMGAEDGLPLAALQWEPDTLGWDGQIAIGGTVDAVTLLAHQGLSIVVVTVLGRLLPIDYSPYPQPHHRGKSDTEPPAFEDALLEVDDGFYTFLLPEESALVSMAENALMNRLRISLHGRIATQNEGWHDLVALPLILEKTTLLADL